MSELSDQQREELHKLRDVFVESLRDYIDSMIFIGDVKSIRKLIATNRRFLDRQVKKLKEKPT